MRIRCIALDLDRTTLNSEGHLSGDNRKAIEQAVSSGIQIAVASGRSLDSLPGGGSWRFPGSAMPSHPTAQRCMI